MKIPFGLKPLRGSARGVSSAVSSCASSSQIGSRGKNQQNGCRRACDHGNRPLLFFGRRSRRYGSGKVLVLLSRKLYHLLVFQSLQELSRRLEPVIRLHRQSF